MQNQSLRQTANQLLRTDRRGKYQDRKHRAYVIHKMIHDLYTIQKAPASWQTLKPEHIHSLVNYWKKRRINPATMMRYMTIIRRFLPDMDCHLTKIDNKSLQLVRIYKRKRAIKNIKPVIWRSIHEPDMRLIMALQIEFGLTFSEAIRIQPFVHVQTNDIWVTRDIAFNSTDRYVPLLTECQKEIVAEFNSLTHAENSLIALRGYEFIRIKWRQAITTLKLPALKRWRYLYAQQRYQRLLPELGHYKTCLTIRREMGIKSRNTLWLYLNA
ncbi:MAG: phage integrase N-terminal domain-containing protein [Legionella sp.]|nr:phage integrase N-terminal domain-containing protein [Legionella sp.]